MQIQLISSISEVIVCQ